MSQRYKQTVTFEVTEEFALLAGHAVSRLQIIGVMDESKKRYLLRIELLHAHRPIWREVVVPSDLALNVLDDVIQLAMGWEQYHLHEFEFKGVRYRSEYMRAEDFEGAVAEETVSLNELLKRVGQKLSYVYDFADDWRHSVSLKATLPWDEAEIFVCTDGEGACPLEDCGGVYGHEQVCRYVRDPDSGDDALIELKDWVPQNYDPDRFDRNAVNEELDELRLEQSDLANAELYDEIIDEFKGEGMPYSELDAFMDAEGEDDVIAPEPYAGLSEEELHAFRSVFREGAKFREAEPWKDLWDQDIFGVRDPESGLLDFVSIMGRGGEVFGVHVHRPPEGYDFWYATKDGTLSMETVSSYLRQIRLVELEFINKAEMQPEDLELYDRLNYPAPPRGRRRWMRVRRYHPRSVPWFAEPNELAPLVRGAALACRFVETIRAEPDRTRSEYIEVGLREQGVPASLPVFELPPKQASNDWMAWELKVRPINWLEAKAERQGFVPPENELECLAALPVIREIWEVGASYLEDACMTEKGPVVPIVAAVAVIEETGQMFMPYLSPDRDESPGACVWNAFLQATDERGGRPSSLHVNTGIAYQTFEPLSRRTGMGLKRVTDSVHLGSLFSFLDQVND